MTDTRTPRPALLGEAAAAQYLSESPELRRKRRYRDAERLARGEQIQGPPWIVDGGRVKYRAADLDGYVARLGDVLTERQRQPGA